MLIKYLYIFAFILLTFSAICGQVGIKSNSDSVRQISSADSRVENARRQAEEMNKAYINNDFAAFVDFVHPKILAGIGGREKLIEITRKLKKQGEDANFEIISLSVGEPNQLLKVDSELFINLPYTLILKGSKAKLKQESTIIGISTDEGNNWKFVSGLNQEKFKTLFPKAAEKIQIPATQPPKLIENE